MNAFYLMLGALVGVAIFAEAVAWAMLRVAEVN